MYLIGNLSREIDRLTNNLQRDQVAFLFINHNQFISY